MKKFVLIPVLLLALVIMMAACTETTPPADTTGESVVPTEPESTPEETVPEDTTPEDTTPEDTTPEGTTPEDTVPETPPETKPAETKPAETKPAETKPAETADPNEPTLLITAEELTPGQGRYDMDIPVLSDDGSYITITPAPIGGGKGNDPYYYPFGAAPYLTGDRYLAVKYRTDKGEGTSLQMYVGSDVLDNDNDMLMTPIVSDGEWHLAIFDLSLIDGQTSDMTGATAAPGYYDGSTVAFLRIDAMEVNYMMDAEGKPYKIEVEDPTTGNTSKIWARYDMPEGAYIDIAYLAFFSTEEGAKVYEATINPAPVEPTNVALGKTVEANNAEELGFFSAAQLVDGRHGEAFVSDEPLGWHSLTTMAGQTSVDAPILLEIDLDGSYQLSSVTLIPMRFYEGNSLLPLNFDIQVSTDGEEWTTVYSATDASAVWGEGVKVTYEFDAVTASWIRLHITKDSAFNGFCGLGEMEVYGIPA